MLKSVFFAFISLIENSPLEIQRRYIKQISPWRTNHNNIFVNCTGIALTLEKLDSTFTRFNPSPSFSSAATDDSKQIQCINLP